MFAQWADDVFRKFVSFIDISADFAYESFFAFCFWLWFYILLIVGMLIFIPTVSVFYTIFREYVYLCLKKQNIKRVTRTDVVEYTEEEINNS